MLVRIHPVVFAAASLVMACNGSDPLDGRDEAPASAADPRAESEADPLASARISPKSGSSVSGEATLTPRDGEVVFVMRLSNAPPGSHAVHLHEIGDCGAPDASTAGEHWNPDGKPHGKRGSGTFHAGDLGNIDIAPDGNGSLTLSAKEWSLDSGSERNPVGKAIVIHAKPDDFATQPDGAGGQRIGCGVIENGRK